MTTKVFAFDDLKNSDLVIDATYQSKQVGTAVFDPLCPLLPEFGTFLKVPD